MLCSLAKRLMLIPVLLAMALVSVQAAARMVPPAAAADAWMAGQISPGDFCGEPGGTGQHGHCPLCHKLGATPQIRLSPGTLRMVPVPVWAAMSAILHLDPQHGNPNRPARAPPVTA